METGLGLIRKRVMPFVLFGNVLTDILVWGALDYLPWGNWVFTALLFGAWATIETVAWRSRRRMLRETK